MSLSFAGVLHIHSIHLPSTIKISIEGMHIKHLLLYVKRETTKQNGSRYRKRLLFLVQKIQK